MNKPSPLLSVRNLTLRAEVKHSIFYPVQNLSIDILPEQKFGLFGESGSGKSLTALAIAGLLPQNINMESGNVYFNDRQIINDGIFSAPEIRGQNLSYIFQDPKSALHPLFTIGSQFTDIVKRHHDLPAAEVKKNISKLLQSVGLSGGREMLNAYPHQLSGGMAQRVLIAMALSAQPDLIIADEPTTALDPELKEQILSLLMEKQKSYKFSILLITHEIEIIKKQLDQYAEMKNGEIQNIVVAG